jgi:hypothetical protein
VCTNSSDLRNSTIHAIRPISQDKAHQLIPIQKFLTSIKNDVRETCEALVAVSCEWFPACSALACVRVRGVRVLTRTREHACVRSGLHVGVEVG